MVDYTHPFTMSNTNVGMVYDTIIQEVINSVRVDFEENGIEEGVLDELKKVRFSFSLFPSSDLFSRCCAVLPALTILPLLSLPRQHRPIYHFGNGGTLFPCQVSSTGRIHTSTSSLRDAAALLHFKTVKSEGRWRWRRWLNEWRDKCQSLRFGAGVCC